MRFALVLGSLCLATSVAAQAPKRLTVLAHDYAYTPLDSLSAGETVFSLQNKGTVRHEVVIYLLKPGRTLADFMAAKTPEERRALNDGVIGLIVAEPGESAPGRLLASLSSGRTYLLFCNLRDTPEKPPHTQLGMVSMLHVK